MQKQQRSQMRREFMEKEWVWARFPGYPWYPAVILGRGVSDIRILYHYEGVNTRQCW